MTFPATNLNEAVGLIVPDSNAFHNVINGDVNEDVTLPEGGEVPTLRKALESLKVVGDPIGEWTSGVTEFTAYNQYATYLGIPWRVKPETILPYTAQGSDPSSLPDSDFVQPYQENDYGTVADGIEVKHRRGTNAEILAGTPAIGELWINTTDSSIHMGDGVTQGGVKHINVKTLGNYTDLFFNSVAEMTASNLPIEGYKLAVAIENNQIRFFYATTEITSIPLQGGLYAKELAFLPVGFNLIDIEAAMHIPSGKLAFWVEGATVASDDYLLFASTGLVYTGAAGVLPATPADPWFKYDRVRDIPLYKSKGYSKEEQRNANIGVNHISNMRTGDPAIVTGAAGFSAGVFTGDNADNFAAWELPFSANSFVCQGRVYWDGTQNNALIGYNTGAAGTAPTSTFYCVGFASTGFVFNDRVTLDILEPAVNLTTGRYEITMIYNVDFFLVSLQKEGETTAKTYVVNKSLGNPTNAMIGAYGPSDQISDFRFTANQSNSTWCPAFGGGRHFHTPILIPSTNPSGVDIAVHLPAGYDPKITHRLAVFNHGSGGTGADIWDYPNENGVLTELLNAGYVVMAASYEITGWGNPLSVSQNIAAINYVRDRYNVYEDPYFIVQSMGGMTGLNTILRGGIKPSAVAGIYPATNLRYQYDNGFTAAIEAAYGFTGSENFDAATNPYDVLNDNQPVAFNGLKMKFWHSYADTVVPRVENTDQLKLQVSNGGGLFDVVTSTGEHGDPSSFDGAGIVEFFKDK